MKLVGKIVLSVVAAVAFAYGILLLWLIAAFSGGSYFHQILVPLGGIALLLFLLACLWKWFRLKTRLVALAAIIGLMSLSIGGVAMYDAYHEGIPQVNEQGVNLKLYEPFAENTMAASLDGPSALRLEGDLPKLDGATALYPLYSAFARATYPEGEYSASIDKEGDFVVCTNTVGAYQRLIGGEADVIFVAGPSKEQSQWAKENGLELSLTPIGKEAFVFFVNAKNPVNNLSARDIRSIYAGNAVNWKEVGGDNAAIRAFQRPQNSGSQTMLQKIMGDTPLMTPPSEDVATGMGGIIQEVSAYRNYRNAIGYSFLFFATEMVKNDEIELLSIDGIAPTRENVANSSYPYAAEFYAVTAGTGNENVQTLIDWILSAQGQTLVEKTGYTPVR